MNNQTKSNAPAKKKRGMGYIALFITAAIFIIIIGLGTTVGFVTASVSTVPEKLGDIRPDISTQFFDANGDVLTTTFSEQNRLPVKLSKVPKNLQDAFISVEDVRFYEHFGIDIKGIFRAVWTNLINSGYSEGGSTITQQLAKNAFLSQERTLKRKIQEAVIAVKLERQYTKQEILEMYLNQIYFGQGAYGVETAALTYFGKHVEDLNLAECAVLAGIPKSPNYYSPMNNFKASKSRQAVVLDQMEKYRFITAAQASAAKSQKLDIKTEAVATKDSISYFVDYVSQIVVEKFGAEALYRGGLKVYTTIDSDIQKAAEASLALLPVYSKDTKGLEQPQIAIVAVDTNNGHIKAMIGGRGNDQFNRAVLAERQPGSAFKPFVYLAGMESGMTPSTVVDDKRTAFSADWSPNNYDHTFHGRVTLQTAFKYSYNIPAVLVAQQATPEKVLYYTKQMGISTIVDTGRVNDHNLAMSLGGLSKGVTPLELATAFAVFANNGNYNKNVAITKIVDRNGKTIYEDKAQPVQVASEKSIFYVNRMMQDVIESGTGRGANIGRPAGGKTGTTDTYKDAWFVGFTPYLSAAVWLGQDDGTNLPGITGGDLPARIWQKFMTGTADKYPADTFKNPGGYSMPTSGGLIKNDNDTGDKAVENKNDKKPANTSKPTTANTTTKTPTRPTLPLEDRPAPVETVKNTEPVAPATPAPPVEAPKPKQPAAPPTERPKAPAPK